MPDNYTSELLAAACLGEMAGKIHDMHDLPVLVARNETRLYPLEGLLDRPARIRAAVTLAGLPDLIAYVKTHFVAGDSVIFANPVDHSFKAILDYHGATSRNPDSDPQVLASWCKHTADCKLVPSKAFKTWTGLTGWLKQPDFADFLEDNEADILPPENSSASMHSLIESFRATRTQTFSSFRNRDNGDGELTFKSETKGDTSVALPRQFHIAIPLYERDREAIKISVLLKHDLDKEKGLVFAIRLLQVERILEKKWEEDLAALTAALDGVAQVFEGIAPGPPAPLNVI